MTRQHAATDVYDAGDAVRPRRSGSRDRNSPPRAGCRRIAAQPRSAASSSATRPLRRIRRALHRAPPQSATPNRPLQSSHGEPTALIRTRLARASNCSDRLRTNRGQCAAPGIRSTSGARTSDSRCTRRGSAYRAAKNAANASRTACVIQNRLRPAAAAAEYVAIREAAACDQHLKVVERTSTARADRTCVRRTVSKPARSNTAAISRWLLTPCSRNTATRGRAPRFTYGATTSSAGANVSFARMPGSSAAMRANSSSAQAGSSRSRCIR